MSALLLIEEPNPETQCVRIRPREQWRVRNNKTEEVFFLFFFFETLRFQLTFKFKLSVKQVAEDTRFSHSSMAGLSFVPKKDPE